MTIQVGDKLPEAKFRVMTAEGPQVKTTDDIFKGKKVALFAVPGAYTGTCHKMHLPSIFLNAYAIKDKGVNTIAIVSVNSTPPATGSASAPIATRCWWMTAWSRNSTANRRPARSRFPAATRCWGSSDVF
jgi:hypothetical protein